MEKYKVLFWSGGKDSLLARHFLDPGSGNLLMFTTFNEEERIVPYQNIPLSVIQQHAVALGHTLTTVPLPFPCSNEIYLERVFAALGNMPFEIDTLIFGDWHLDEIKSWREKVFNERGLNCQFPIWRRPLEELLSAIEEMNVKILVNSVSDKYKDRIKMGREFNRDFVTQLPGDIDPMGENGEFHTLVVFD